MAQMYTRCTPDIHQIKICTRLYAREFTAQCTRVLAVFDSVVLTDARSMCMFGLCTTGTELLEERVESIRSQSSMGHRGMCPRSMSERSLEGPPSMRTHHEISSDDENSETGSG